MRKCELPKRPNLQRGLNGSAGIGSQSNLEERKRGDGPAPARRGGKEEVSGAGDGMSGGEVWS